MVTIPIGQRRDLAVLERAVALKPTRRGGFAFRAVAMLGHYGIGHPTTRRWAATVDGRMLIVRLDEQPQWEAGAA